MTQQWNSSDDAMLVRHQGTQHMIKLFAYAHLPEHLQAVSRPCGDLARAMVDALPDGPELTAGLRKLLEAKDCFVRSHPGAQVNRNG